MTNPKGRAAGLNPKNRFEPFFVDKEAAGTVATEYQTDSSRSVLTANDRPDIDFFNFLESDTAVVFECTDRGYQYYQIGFEIGLATLDIGEFFRAEVRAETRFGDGVFGEVQG